MYKTSNQDTGEQTNHETLYGAMQAIAGQPAVNVIRDRKLVAYFDGTRVRAGFGATDAEREQIAMDAGLLAA